MIRYCLLFFLFLCSSHLALADDADKKKIPDVQHMEHPDHVPHHGGKDPIKKVTQDELVFPRKRKKLYRLITA